MLAGSPMSRAAGPNMIWYCQQGSHGDDPNSLGRNSRFPVEKCWDFLRSEITFPNWYADHKLEGRGIARADRVASAGLVTPRLSIHLRKRLTCWREASVRRRTPSSSPRLCEQLLSSFSAYARVV